MSKRRTETVTYSDLRKAKYIEFISEADYELGQYAVVLDGIKKYVEHIPFINLRNYSISNFTCIDHHIDDDGYHVKYMN